MTLTSTLGSPGIEIRENDNSIRLDSSTAVTIFVPGFTSQGPVDQVMPIRTITDFETIYGIPTNSAERYFYYTVKAILDGSSNGVTLLCSRLPYGEGEGDTVSNAYTMLAYPAIPVKKKGSNNYDQFIFDDVSKENITKFFTANEITPSILNYSLVIDDDSVETLPQSLTISGLDAEKVTIPDINEEITDENLITFEMGDYDVDARLASEKDNGNTIVHMSCTIKTDEDKCGCFYLKLSYKGDVIGKTVNGFEEDYDGSITANFEDAYEVCESYTSGDDSEITYVIGSPVTYHISLSEYYKIITGELLNWEDEPYDFSSDATDTTKKFGHFDALGHAAFITINTSRSIINNNFEGFYIGLNDNMFISPSDEYDFNCIENMKITTDYYHHEDDNKMGLIDKEDNTGNFQVFSPNRLSFFLDNNSQGSISSVLSRNITSLDIASNDYDDTISMALFKMTKSTDNMDVLKLNYSIREKYNWSFGKTRLKSVPGSNKPVSYFAENVLENSSNITILINPNIAKKSYIDADGIVKGKMRIYNNKLMNNLDMYEKKYLTRSYQQFDSNTKERNKIYSSYLTAKIAQSSINSWNTLAIHAGITPKMIKSFKTDYPCFQQLNSIMPFGTYMSVEDNNKKIGELPVKLERALRLVENDEQYPDIDIILESGLGTVYMCSKANDISTETAGLSLLVDETGFKSISAEESNAENIFDENIILQGVEDMRTGRTSLTNEAQDVLENYLSIQNVFLNFANSMQNGGRGDTFYISDIPRQILIKGKNTKITSLYGSLLENNSYDFGENVNHSFSTSIYYPIKHIFDNIVSSYTSVYAQWVRINDYFSSDKVWIPISGFIAANMAANDTAYGPWYATAGLRRGVINGVLDYAISPSPTQRTDLYKLCVISVPKIPNYGLTIWGTRTMSKKDSAFDQNTCRRTFLYMQKKVKQLLRYYIFEPNTSYTRLQIYNDLDPFLESVKNNGGIYSYTLVCDTSNNTPDVINNGDLVVSIAAAPTRTAENIVVEFTANKYSEEVSAAESIF